MNFYFILFDNKLVLIQKFQTIFSNSKVTNNLSFQCEKDENIKVQVWKVPKFQLKFT